MARIVEDPMSAGTFEITSDFTPDPEREGTFHTSPWIIEDPTREGTFIEYNPLDYLPEEDPLTGHRSAYRRYELLDGDGAFVRDLLNVQGATVKQSAQATLKRGGQASITDTGEQIDWLNSRIRCVYGITGYGEWGLGVFLPSLPREDWDGTTRHWDVELIDSAAVLATSRVAEDYALAAGTVATDAVRTLIEEAGESAAAVTDSDKTLTTARVWEVGTPRLTIINELLLDSIGYFSLASDGDGHLTARPYARPSDRPVEWEFIDGATCIYRDTFSREQDIYNVPNHIIAMTRGTGDEPALHVSVYNENPDSPFSTVSRGRIITGDPIETDATDLDALTVIAERALNDATTPTSTIVIDALPVPIDVNAIVRFRRDVAGIDARHVVTNIEYGAGDTDLARYTLREVVDT